MTFVNVTNMFKYYINTTINLYFLMYGQVFFFFLIQVPLLTITEFQNEKIIYIPDKCARHFFYDY